MQAAREGNVAALRAAGLTLEQWRAGGCELLRNAAGCGQLGVLELMAEQGAATREDCCAGNCEALRRAAMNDNLPVVNWLAERGCVTGACVRRRGPDWADILGDEGEEYAMAWLRARDTEVGDCAKWYYSAVETAAAAGNLGLLEHFEARMGPGEYDWRLALTLAAQAGLPVLKWLGAKISQRQSPGHVAQVCREAELLQWAAKQGDMGMLGWLEEANAARPEDCRARGCEVMTDAAKEGHIHVLEWLKEKGCATPEDCWKARVLIEAAGAGKLEVLRWLEERIGKGELRRWLAREAQAAAEKECANSGAAAAEGGHVGVLDWLLERGCVPRHVHNVLFNMVYDNHLPALEWLARHKLVTPGMVQRNYQELLLTAAKRGGVPMLEWLVETKRGLTAVDVQLLRASEAGEAVRKWLDEKEGDSD